MSEIRIGTANSEPAAGTLKVGSGDVQEIYLGNQLIWPATSPSLDDPYNQVQGTNFRYLAVGTFSPYRSIRLYDESWNTITPTDGSGNNITFASIPLPSLSYDPVITGSDKHEFIAIAARNTGYPVPPRWSSDFGQSFTQLAFPAVEPNSSSGNISSLKLSKSGQVLIYKSTSNPSSIEQLVISNNFASTYFVASFGSVTTDTIQSYNLSGGGKYIIVSAYLASSTSRYLFLSDDYGQTFTDITSRIPLSVSQSVISVRSVGVSAKGRYMYVIANINDAGQNVSRLYRSSNFGTTFSFLQGVGFSNTESYIETSMTGQYFIHQQVYSRKFGAPAIPYNAGQFISLSNTGKNFISTPSSVATEIISTNFLSTITNSTNKPYPSIQGVLVDI